MMNLIEMVIFANIIVSGVCLVMTIVDDFR